MEKEKKKIAIKATVILLIAISLIGVTYAVWQFVLKQTGENNLTIGCFSISFTDKNPISIGSAFPTSEESGRLLTPYEFTIENTCDAESSYQINLEVLNTSTLEKHEYIRVLLEEGETEGTSKVLISDDVVEKTLENASTSYKLSDGKIEAKEEKTYTLRMWLDENTPASGDIMGKTFNTKVTISTALGTGDVIIPGGSGPNIVTEQVQSSITYIKKKAEDGQLIEDDETEDHNLRYIGAAPNNYVYFNCDDNDNPDESTCELWRVIGFMNNIDDGTGKRETRLKLIRNDSIGAYSWDSSVSTVNSGYGVNEWSQADLMKLLNPGYEEVPTGGSLYWRRSNGKCFNGSKEVSTNCNFVTTGLKDTAKDFIGNAVWHLGANPSGTSAQSEAIVTSGFYEYERSENTGKICTSGSYCTDEVERTTAWTGLVGLMYPSDYGYATSGGANTMRVTCLVNPLSTWNSGNYTDCKNNDWLYKSNKYQWTMMPYSYSSKSIDVFNIHGYGYMNSYSSSDAYLERNIYPVVYIKSNVRITGGDGSSDYPFTLGTGEASGDDDQEEDNPTKKENLTYIKNNGIAGQLITNDNTADHNARYVGKTPNNYIDIGDRDLNGNLILWQIVGYMNNVDDGTGNKEARLKIVREESIGTYSWDTSDSTINNGYGVNEWSQADLMKLLNPGYEDQEIGGSLYWNSGSGQCYSGRNESSSACDFTNTGLSDEAKNLVKNALWHTGSNYETTYTYNTSNAFHFYNFERGSHGKNCTSGNSCNDDVTRTASWTGPVGLISVSDYGFSTAGSSSTSRSTCYNKNLYSWISCEATMSGTNCGVDGCAANSWIYQRSGDPWTLNSYADTSKSSEAFKIYTYATNSSNGGRILNTYSCYSFHVYPTLYLKPEVTITSGNGSKALPFVASLS